MKHITSRLAYSVVMVTCLLATACGSGPAAGTPSELRLGYYANLTHASALVGMKEGFFSQALGSQTTLDRKSTRLNSSH